MKVRTLREEDIPELKRIHKEQYPDHEFPDFSKNYYSTIVIMDDDEKIIVAGGVRAIAEATIFTDKSCSLSTKKNALIQLMGACLFTCAINNQDTLYAFVHGEDDTWVKALESFEFKKDSDQLFKKDV